MLDKKCSSFDVLFVNGINTKFGGSVSESNRTWLNSFRENDIAFEVLNSVPSFGFSQKNRWYLLLLSIYFLPGTLFRLTKAEIFEFAYKLSPFMASSFIWAMIVKRPRRIIFSHHSVCYLALLCSRAKRIFLIHDLMYVRSRSRGSCRRLQRLFLNLELRIYRLAPTVLVQSYHEWRLLRCFLGNTVYLIGCCDLNLVAAPMGKSTSLAVISDWRRQENVHGAVQFFSSPIAKTYEGRELSFRFFGFSSQTIVERLRTEGVSHNVSIVNGGTFGKVSDISEGFFFVPIYQGAGIKRKTLEALSAGRMVVGTKAAFIGLPAWLIAEVTWRVTSIADLQVLPSFPKSSVFNKVLGDLAKRFNSIGEIPDLK